MKKYQIVLIHLLLGLMVFGHGLSAEFVMDDNAQIVENPLVYSLKYIPKLFFSSTFYSGDANTLTGAFYRPLMMSVFAVIYSVFGPAKEAYHFIQLLIHITNAILVYYLLRKFIKSKICLLGSLLFLIHPLNIEAVIYASNLQEVMFTLFGLLSLLINVYKPNRWSDNRVAFVTNAFFLLALFSKETGILWLFITGFYLWKHDQQQFRRMLPLTVSTVLFYAALRFNAVGLHQKMTVIPIANATVTEKLLSLPKIWAYYLQNFIFPNQISTNQFWVVRDLSLTSFVYPVMFILGLITLYGIAYVKLIKERFLLTWFGLWLFAGLLLHSHIIPLDVTVADRWFYTTSIAGVGLLGLFLDHCVPKKLWIYSLIILLPFAISAYIRVSDWQSALGLYLHDYKMVGSNFGIDNLIGGKYLELHDYSLAKEYLEQSIAHEPRWGTSQNNLALTYEFLGDQHGENTYYQKAVVAYSEAIKYGAGVSPFINLARIMVEKAPGDFVTTQNFLRNSITKFPSQPDLWYLLSKWEYVHGNKVEALQAARNFDQLLRIPESDLWLKQVELMK